MESTVETFGVWQALHELGTLILTVLYRSLVLYVMSRMAHVPINPGYIGLAICAWEFLNATIYAGSTKLALIFTASITGVYLLLALSFSLLIQ